MNGESGYIINHDLTELPETITPEQIAVMDYLFKEVNLSDEDDFRELGSEFDE